MDPHDELRSSSKKDLIREVIKLRELLSRQLRPTEMLMFESGTTVAGKAFVRMWWGEQSGQLTVEEAYKHAKEVMETAAAAAFDAAFVRLFREQLDVDDRVLFQLLVDMREYRAELGFDGGESRSAKTETTLRPTERSPE